jgi:uncharacterized protein (DUF2141 family)
MNVRVQPSLLLLVFVVSLVSVVGGRAYAQANTDVYIQSLAIVGNTLTIKGRNFGAGTPTVQVGQSTATVSSNTDSQIVAETVALSPGTYQVKVVRDTSEGGSALSTLRIQ